MFSWANGWIQDGLECGALEFDKEDFENIIFNRDFPFRWISFILIYSLYYTILPEWNIELWQNTIRQLWRICQSVGPITATWNDMQRLLCVKGDIGRFYKGIGYSQVYQLEEEWIQFFELCASADPEWFLEFWMTEPPSNVPPIFKSDLYIAWITDKKEEFMARPLPVKEELIATTWSPSRILPWILDSDEKQEVGKRWVL